MNGMLIAVLTESSHLTSLWMYLEVPVMTGRYHKMQISPSAFRSDQHQSKISLPLLFQEKKLGASLSRTPKRNL